jgi:NAD(P)-dependent dehydrogenase (short-subunit alcohol dehydrogenase family)
MAATNETTSHGRLQDKVAIVTGASSGIGRAISTRYASKGAHVIVADLQPTSRNPKESQPTHELVQSLGRKSVFIKTDVTSAASVDALIEATIKEFGRVDILCNNAGAAFEEGKEKRKIWELEDSKWQKSLDLYCSGVFYGTRAASRQMMKQDVHANSGDRGWIINTASILGQVGIANAGECSICNYLELANG